MHAEQLLVAQHIAQKGPPRRFEPDVRCSVYYARDYLAKHNIHIQLRDGQCWILENKRWKRLRWSEVLGMVDQLRMVEGKEPLKAVQQ